MFVIYANDIDQTVEALIFELERQESQRRREAEFQRTLRDKTAHLARANELKQFRDMLCNTQVRNEAGRVFRQPRPDLIKRR